MYMDYILDDRDLYIEATRLELEGAKLDAILTMSELNNSINKMGAEIKVLTESGTNDDIVYLFKEADEAADEEKEGILASIGKWFKSILKAIGDFFRGLSGAKEDPNAEVEVDESEIEKAEAAPSIISSIKNVITNPTVQLAAVATGAIGSYAAIHNTGKKVKIAEAKAEELMKEQDEMVKVIDHFVQECEKKDSKIAKLTKQKPDLLRGMKSAGGAAFSSIKNIFASIKNAAGNAANAVNNIGVPKEAKAAPKAPDKFVDKILSVDGKTIKVSVNKNTGAYNITYPNGNTIPVDELTKGMKDVATVWAKKLRLTPTAKTKSVKD